jgi:hypothetical protein
MRFPGVHLRFPLALAATALVGLGCGAAHETDSSEPMTTDERMITAELDKLPGKLAEDWKAVRKALTKYHDVNTALADGYVNTQHCATDATGAAMGIHFIRFDLAMDLVNDPMQPEFLLYVPDEDAAGGYRLVGVEYYQAAVGQPAPGVLGQQMDGPMPGHNPGEPEHYDLHVWLYRHNPSGLFAQYNPQVKCGGHAGH